MGIEDDALPAVPEISEENRQAAITSRRGAGKEADKAIRQSALAGIAVIWLFHVPGLGAGASPVGHRRPGSES
jgi:hypothetical protein